MLGGFENRKKQTGTLEFLFPRMCLYEPCRTAADDLFSPSVLCAPLTRGESVHCVLRFFQFFLLLQELSYMYVSFW